MDEKFPSFNGLNRPAMMFGVPMVAALFTLIFMIITAFLGVMLGAGKYSLILPFFGFCYLIFLKIICADDPNALAIVQYRLQARLLKISQGNPVIYLTSNSTKRDLYNARRQFKKC